LVGAKILHSGGNITKNAEKLGIFIKETKISPKIFGGFKESAYLCNRKNKELLQ